MPRRGSSDDNTNPPTPKLTGEELPHGDSTLLRRGNEASTFKDMVFFAEMLETRPLAQLLEELPGLASMSEAKFALAVKVLRRRFKKEPEVNRQQLHMMAEEVAGALDDPAARAKVRNVFV